MVILSLLSSFLELAEDTFVIYPLALNVIMKLQIYLKKASLGSERSVGKTVLETPSGFRDSACVRSSSSFLSLHRCCSVCRRCKLTQSSQWLLSCHLSINWRIWTPFKFGCLRTIFDLITICWARAMSWTGIFSPWTLRQPQSQRLVPQSLGRCRLWGIADSTKPWAAGADRG